MKRDRQDGPGAIELIEEAFQLLRSARISTWAVYYLGTLPFVLALLYFWSDMSRGVLAEERLVTGATALVIVFIWMKCCQAVFARKLLAQVTGKPDPRWDRARLWRVVLMQIALQPSGLFLLPAGAVVLMPFAWVFAFYQNATLFGAGDEPTVAGVFKSSWRQMKIWPAQSQCLILALKLFALFVFINMLLGALAIPFFLKGLLGIETAFSQSWFAALNTTFIATVFGLTWLCLDPLVKASYVLRCFHGQSLESAEDLRAELRARNQGPTLAVMAASFLLLAGPAFGQRAAPESATVTPAALERSIAEVIKQREYTWRLPREKAPATRKDMTWLQRRIKPVLEWCKSLAQKTLNWLQKIRQWLGQNRRPGQSPSAGVDWYFALKALLVLLSVALVAFIIMLLLGLFRKRRLISEAVAARAVAPAPDIANEKTAADELPEDGWLRLARELLAAGDLRLALRAYYLASLAQLAERNLITIARYKSNRDYQRELARRAHSVPVLLDVFGENVSTFDRVWYGLHEVTHDLLNRFASNVDRIKTC